MPNAEKAYLGDVPLFEYEKTLFPIEIDGVVYEEEDAHIFVANGNAVNLPIPSGSLPIFVAVNGVDVTPTSFVTRTVEVEEIGEDDVATTSIEEVEVASISANDGDIIHAIFDWNNSGGAKQDWYSDILQFGLNSSTGERNQINNGVSAFDSMTANPAAISTLNVFNVKNMNKMFKGAESFDQDISGWNPYWVTNMAQMFLDAKNFNSDISGWNIHKVTNTSKMFQNAVKFDSDISGWNTSKVKNMGSMFKDASSFDQDLSEWCASLFETKPTDFDLNSGFAGQTDKQPQWKACPRMEIVPDPYTVEDCHIFVANGNAVHLPITEGWNPSFVAVDTVEKDYET